MNSTGNKAKPVVLLENYRSDSQTIAVLRDALHDAPRASAHEIIDSMNFSHGDGMGGSVGHISDKTAYIALHYRKAWSETNKDSTDSLARQLWNMEQERERLNFYVSLLEPRQKKVIQHYYMESVSREKIAAELGVTVRTFHKIRKTAITRLVAMYDLTGNSEQ